MANWSTIIDAVDRWYLWVTDNWPSAMELDNSVDKDNINGKLVLIDER